MMASARPSPTIAGLRRPDRAGISLSLYEGSNASGTLLARVTRTHTEFCDGFSNCGQFAFHQMFFAAPVTLSAGTTYFVALTSNAPDVQSEAYFIKSDNFFASDELGTEITPSPLTATETTPTPEPSTFLLSGLGLIALGLVRRKL